MISLAGTLGIKGQAAIDDFDLMHQFVIRLTREALAPPRPGTLAADLTEREKLALAISAGAPYRTSMKDHMLKITIAVPVGISDRPGGGYFVAIGSMHKVAGC